MKFLILLVLSFQLWSSFSFGWGNRGHEIVGSVAARILEEKKGFKFLRDYEYEIGYYVTVPDLVWRKTAAKQEPPMHYLDWNETFVKAFGTPMNLPIEFKDYKAKMGEKYNIRLGASPWRIHDLINHCNDLKKNIKEKELEYLVCMGVLGHYTGDLSMPLHVTDNHDGQMTGQKGVHVYFEGPLVNQLDPSVKVEVMKKALETYEKSPMAKMKPDEAVRWMIANSYSRIPELLGTDKNTNRSDLKAAASKFKNLIVERLVQGAILTAVVWNQVLDGVKDFHYEQLRFIDGTPNYIELGEEI
jgi:hypothetical protein